MMRGSLLVQLAAIVACTATHPALAHADKIQLASGFTFDLPNIGLAWAQEKRGDVLLVEDDTDKVPELQMFVFLPAREGDVSDIVSRLPTEVVRPGVELVASTVKSAKLVGGVAKETIADASVATGEMKLDGQERAAYAVVQRKGHSVILLAVPKDGIYERGLSNFRAVLHGLEKPGATTPVAATPVAAKPAGVKPAVVKPAADAVTMPRLPPVIAIREITATSTFADKHDLYAAWRVIGYQAVLDKATKDYVPTTAWCEGKPDEGVGEGVTISFASPTQLDAIQIAAGVWKSDRLFNSNNQITSLEVVVDGKSRIVTPARKRTWLDVPIGGEVSKLVVRIAAVAKGKMNDTCISGISLVRKDNDFTPIIGIDAHAAVDLPRALVAIETALETDRSAFPKLFDFPFSMHVPGATNVAHASAKSLEAACDAQDQAQAAGTFDDTKPTCPPSIGSSTGDDRPATASSTEPATVSIVFAGHRDVQDVWRLRWHDGAWHLVAIDYQ